MSNRTAKRNNNRVIAKVANNAKKDMQEYLDSIGDKNITIEEMTAWKFGYLAGLNRANINNQG